MRERNPALAVYVFFYVAFNFIMKNFEKAVYSLVRNLSWGLSLKIPEDFLDQGNILKFVFYRLVKGFSFQICKKFKFLTRTKK